MKVCPKCGNQYEGYPAISRTDNKTEICSECGMIEAIQAWYDAEREKYNVRISSRTEDRKKVWFHSTKG